LQELQSLEKYYQRYRIDDHLKRYEKAVENLSKAGNQYFDQVVNYTKLHSLYTFTLQLYSNVTPEKKVYSNNSSSHNLSIIVKSCSHQSFFQTILMAYADYLQGRTNYDEAAIGMKTFIFHSAIA
jgi:elongator complex protein 1